MAIRFVRQPNETPNISNVDDIVGLRYAYGGQNGYVIGKGAEIGYSVSGSTFKITSGRLVLQGVESDIDANGVPIIVDNIATKRFYSVYYEVNLSLQIVKISAVYDTVGYPDIDTGDDLTTNSSGIARMELYRFVAQSGSISDVTKIVAPIVYAKNLIFGDDNLKDDTISGDKIKSDTICGNKLRANTIGIDNLAPETISSMKSFELIKDFGPEGVQEWNTSSSPLSKNDIYLVESQTGQFIMGYFKQAYRSYALDMKDGYTSHLFLQEFRFGEGEDPFKPNKIAHFFEFNDEFILDSNGNLTVKHMRKKYSIVVYRIFKIGSLQGVNYD